MSAEPAAGGAEDAEDAAPMDGAADEPPLKRPRAEADAPMPLSSRPVTPGDLAATIFYHMGVPLDATYTDDKGRPTRIVDTGEPIRELI